MKEINIAHSKSQWGEIFYNLNDIYPEELILNGYVQTPDGVPVTGWMHTTAENVSCVGLRIDTYPLAAPEPQRVNIVTTRLPKNAQIEVLTEVTNRLSLDLIIPRLVTDFTQGISFVSKPAMGSNSIGLNLGDDIEAFRTHGSVRTESYGELIAVEYISDIVAEYRLLPVPGWENCGYLRSVKEHPCGLYTPTVIEGEVYDLDSLDVPTTVMDNVLSLVKELDIWGYSIDLFKTSDGRWGIHEFNPEYGIVGIPREQAIKLRSLTFQYYLDTAFNRGPVQIDYNSKYFKYKTLARHPNLEGSYVKALRLEQRWDIHTAARELGMSSSRLSEIETGNRPITELMMLKINKCYGVTHEELCTLPPNTDILDDIVRNMTSLERRRFELYLSSTMLPQDQRRSRLAVAKDRMVPPTGNPLVADIKPELKESARTTMSFRSVF